MLSPPVDNLSSHVHREISSNTADTGGRYCVHKRIVLQNNKEQRRKIGKHHGMGRAGRVRTL